ncbi:FadR/GntR family transcriptional regulator [Pseudochelatococcus sp. B33]
MDTPVTTKPAGVEKASSVPARQGVDLSDHVYHKLFSKISSGEFAQHERLPSENEMADEYGVSRPVVRTALKRLRNDGLIYSRQGSGSYVQVSSHEPVVGFGAVGTIADIQRCYEVRISFERDAAYYAALRANHAAIAEIKAAAERLETAARNSDYEGGADFDFHFAVARAANNRYYTQFLTALREHITIGMRVGGTCLTGPNRAIDFVIAEHRAITKAIMAKDAVGAQKAMETHIANARARVFEGKLLDLSL